MGYFSFKFIIVLWNYTKYEKKLQYIFEEHKNVRQKSTTNWRFEVLLIFTLKNNTIRSKKIVVTCFSLTKGRVMFIRPEVIIESLLDLMMLFFKVIVNHNTKIYSLKEVWKFNKLLEIHKVNVILLFIVMF